jgi:hypothetical protein
MASAPVTVLPCVRVCAAARAREETRQASRVERARGLAQTTQDREPRVAGRRRLKPFCSPIAKMLSQEAYVQAALSRSSFAARPMLPAATFTSRMAGRAAGGFAASSVREAGLYVPAAKEKDTWMQGFLKDLAAVRAATRCGARPGAARRGRGGNRRATASQPPWRRCGAAAPAAPRGTGAAPPAAPPAAPSAVPPRGGGCKVLERVQQPHGSYALPARPCAYRSRPRGGCLPAASGAARRERRGPRGAAQRAAAAGHCPNCHSASG